eukprot:TRINITY_DN12849_c0_g1_i2.p1 TRINITY_DN12849_c0_g1~~TRINITY_DN12849_c0_g1_i2.p1  ORF type:complete len:229 (-),score=29.03 TRINITY_DN12849_c0_g1_i2:418-1104(-)
MDRYLFEKNIEGFIATNPQCRGHFAYEEKRDSNKIDVFMEEERWKSMNIYLSTKITLRIPAKNGSLDEALKNFEREGPKVDVVYSNLQYHVSCKRRDEQRVKRTIQEVLSRIIPKLRTEECCKICLEEMDAYDIFSFSICGHQFCRACSTEHVKQSCFDRSNFPLKCPECADLIAVEDIQELVSFTEFERLLQIALEEYAIANANSGKMIPVICKSERIFVQQYREVR